MTILLIINREKVSRQCAENAVGAGILPEEYIEEAAAEFAKLKLSDLLATLIETQYLREDALSGRRFPEPVKFSAN